MKKLFNLSGSKEEQKENQEIKLNEDLIQNGAISIDGISFHKDCNIKEIAKNTKLFRPLNSVQNGVGFENAEIYGEQFKVIAYFENGKIKRIVLNLFVGEKMPENYYPTTKEYIQVIQNLSSQWLIKLLGEPTEFREDKIFYDFSWGGIHCSYEYDKMHDTYDGADIYFNYTMNWQ